MIGIMKMTSGLASDGKKVDSGEGKEAGSGGIANCKMQIGNFRSNAEKWVDSPSSNFEFRFSISE